MTAGTKISDLTANQALADADLAAVVQDISSVLTTTQVTLAELKAYCQTAWLQDVDGGGFDLNNITLLGVGTSSPARGVDIVAGNAAQFRLRSNTTDATAKNGYMQVGHYLNAEEDVALAIMTAGASNNTLQWGGGSSALNTVNRHQFYAAVLNSNNVVTGTEMMRITQIGIRAQIGITGDPTYLVHVFSGASGGTANASFDDLVIENSGGAGMTILTGAASQGAFVVGNSASALVGRLVYDHAVTAWRVYADGSETVRVNDTGMRVQAAVSAAPAYLLHVVTTSSGGTADATADDLVVENSGNAGISVFSGNTSVGNLYFGDDTSGVKGGLQYNHSGDTLRLIANAVHMARISSTGLRLEVGVASNPGTSLLLDLVSTTQAFAPPRMTTTQRDAISSPSAGMVIYNTTTNVLDFYNGSAWGAV